MTSPVISSSFISTQSDDFKSEAWTPYSNSELVWQMSGKKFGVPGKRLANDFSHTSWFIRRTARKSGSKDKIVTALRLPATCQHRCNVCGVHRYINLAISILDHAVRHYRIDSTSR